MVLPVDEYRHTRDAVRYGFAVGKVRVLEVRVLDRSAHERLLDAPSFAEQKRLLSDTAYGRYLETAQTAEDVEEGLEAALDGFYRYLDEAALPQPVISFFKTRYDFANLKATAKARLLGAPLDGLLVSHGAIPADAFREDLEALPAPLGQLARTISSASDVAQIDVAVDHAMFAELARLARVARSPFLSHIAALIVDTGNVKTLVRGQRAGIGADAIRGMLAPGGTVPADEMSALAGLPVAELETALKRVRALARLSAVDLGDPQTLDIATDAVIVDALREGRRSQSGPEPVIAYVFAREAEAAALRVILLGRLSGIPSDILHARLRATYR